jgi:hypothetical protein
MAVILNNLPGPGNYHTNMAAFGSDGKLYFSQGALTKTGTVGLRAYELGCLCSLPDANDMLGYDKVFSRVKVETSNPLITNERARVKTGAFVPFGIQTEADQRIKGHCLAALQLCVAIMLMAAILSLWHGV